MNVDELIDALEELQHRGYGDKLVQLAVTVNHGRGQGDIEHRVLLQRLNNSDNVTTLLLEGGD